MRRNFGILIAQLPFFTEDVLFSKKLLIGAIIHFQPLQTPFLGDFSSCIPLSMSTEKTSQKRQRIVLRGIAFNLPPIYSGSKGKPFTFPHTIERSGSFFNAHSISRPQFCIVDDLKASCHDMDTTSFPPCPFAHQSNTDTEKAINKSTAAG